MIKGEFIKFEDELLKNEKVDLMKNIKIIDALYEEAVALGIFPLKNLLDGLDVDMKIVKVINNVSKTA